jgi:phospholipid transport system substrate-binding protein
MKRFALVIFTIVLALSLGARRPDGDPPAIDAGPTAAHQVTTPRAVVTSSVSRGLAALRSEREGGRPIDGSWVEMGRAARDLFDVDGMARRALGPHWRDLALPERAEFVRLFGDVLRQSFVAIIERRPDHDRLPMDEEIAGDYARVRSRVSPNSGSESRIEYRLLASGHRWAVYDIVLDGVSLVAHLRGQLHEIIVVTSAAQLLERMRTEDRSMGSPVRGAVTDPAASEPEAFDRERLATGLLLGAASRARWR